MKHPTTKHLTTKYLAVTLMAAVSFFFTKPALSQATRIQAGNGVSGSTFEVFDVYVGKRGGFQVKWGDNFQFYQIGRAHV